MKCNGLPVRPSHFMCGRVAECADEQEYEIVPGVAPDLQDTDYADWDKMGDITFGKNEELKTKILVEHPADDESVTPEDYHNLVKEMNEGKADWQIITYSNSKHTFTNPESADYNPTMAKRAWNHTLTFLKEILK